MKEQELGDRDRITDTIKVIEMARAQDVDRKERVWMVQNPTDADYAENVAAINASIGDFMQGERGTTAEEHSQELRREFGLGGEGSPPTSSINGISVPATGKSAEHD